MQSLIFPKVEETIKRFSSYYQNSWMGQDDSLVAFKINPTNENIQQMIQSFNLNRNQSKALGTMIGAAIGDALGAHFEGVRYNLKSRITTGWKDIIPIRFDKGIFTDDTALSLCLADSFIINNFQFDPLDIRHRFVLWWINGYNNGRQHQQKKTSEGIGSSTAKSFIDFLGKPDPFCPQEENFFQQISGNGTIMRLSPIVVAFNNNIEKGLEISRKQSFITHNGIEAADCCQLLFWACCKLWNSKDETIQQVLDTLDQGGILEKLESQGVKSLALSQQENHLPYMEQKKYCTEQNDRNWNWKSKQFQYSPTRLKNQKNLIGIYALDCLAMALHLVYNCQNYQEAMFLAAGRGGDADSVATLVGMLYGSYSGLTKEMIELYIPEMTRWDDFQIAQRSLELLN